MISLATLLGGAAVAYAVARWLRLPAPPFLLLGGLLLNLGGLLPDRALIQDLILLGAAFLAFVAGTELDPARVGGQRGTAIRVAVAQFALVGLCGFLVVVSLGAGAREGVYLALALASSSTLLVVQLLQRRRIMFEPFGRMVLGVLLLQDLFVITLLPVLVRLPEGLGAAARGLAASLVLVVAAFTLMRWVTPWLVLRMDLDDEELLIATLALLFVFIGLATWMGLPLIAGAFLAGISLSRFPTSGIIRGQLTPISDFFLAIFFMSLGGLVGIPDLSVLLTALILAVLVVLLTPPVVITIAEAAGLSARASIEAGLLLAQTSEFSLVVVLQGVTAGHLGEQSVSILVLVTTSTMFLTPFLSTNRMTWRLMALHPLRGLGEPGEPPSDHVLLIGCGDNGWPLLETLLTTGQQVLVIDDDPAVIEALREGGVDCLRGDGSDFEVLRRAGAARARIIISTMRRPRDSLHLLGQARGVPVLVRVFDREDAEKIRRAGGIPVSYADAAAEDFLEWLEQASAVGLDRERRMRPR